MEIIEPGPELAPVLADIGARSFVESHGKSSPPADLEAYVKKSFSEEQFRKEMQNKDAIFRLVYYDDKPAAYSKIVCNMPNPKIAAANVCKLDRLYVLKDYYDKKLGKVLLDLNISLAKEKGQAGMWLYVWTGNARALRFYEREGFKIIADTEFKISETHRNPNYWMYKEF